MKQNRKNRVKNLMLVFLALLMLILTGVIWLNSLSLQNIPMDSRLGRLYMRIAYGTVSSYELRTQEIPGAYPIEAAVRHSDEMYGTQYDDSGIDAFLQYFQESIRTAIQSFDGSLEERTEAEYQQAQKNDCLFVRYADALPMNLLAEWLGGNSNVLQMNEVRSILLSASENGSGIWLRGANGECWFGAVSIGSDGWERYAEEVGGVSCSFADQENLRSDVLLCDSRRQAYSTLTCSVPNYFDSAGEERIQAVLSAFRYSSSVGHYTDGDESVFVNNNSTLRISDEGIITFRANSVQGGLLAYQENEATLENSFHLRMDAARSLIEQVCRSFQTEAGFYLTNVDCSVDQRTIRFSFQYQCNGLPIFGEAGNCAVVEFQDNTLVSAHIETRSFLTTDTLHYLIPYDQLIYMASDSNLTIEAAYFEDEDVYIPRRCFGVIGE